MSMNRPPSKPPGSVPTNGPTGRSRPVDGKPRGAKANKRRARLHKAAMGRRKAAQNDPARITQALTPKLLDREMEAATKLQFGDQEREIQGEQRASDLHNQRIGGWFNEYQAKVQEAQQRTAQVYAQAQASMQQGQQQAQQQDFAQTQQLQAQGQADAASRGAVMDPNASLMAQQAATARGTTSATQSNLLATQGANQGAYMIDQGRIGARSGIEERGKEGARRRTLDKTMRDVQGKKGEFKVKYKSEARDKERKSQLEQMVFAGEMAQNQQKAEGDAAALTSAERKSAAERRSRERIARNSNRTSRANNRNTGNVSSGNNANTNRTSSENNQRSNANKGKAGNKPFTRAEKRSATEKFEKGTALARAGGFKPGKGADAIAYLGSKDVPPALAQAAAELAIYGGVSRKVAAKVRKRYGIRVPALKGPTPPRLRN